MKERILIRPEFDFYLLASENEPIELDDMKDKGGKPIVMPELDAWANEMSPVIIASETGLPYHKDWIDYHNRGLALARLLRRRLSYDYDLWYEAPFEDKSGTVPKPVKIEEDFDKVNDMHIKNNPERKVLFLDFDGVVVTDRYQEELVASNSPLGDAYGARFDPVCVGFLRQIIDATGADIVVTSTWKMEMGLKGIQQMWRARSLPGRVIGVTPDIDPIHRGEEIAAWLDANQGAVRYAIIDDCPFTDFFREEQLQHLFRVDERTGLEKKTMRMVINHLTICEV